MDDAPTLLALTRWRKWNLLGDRDHRRGFLSAPEYKSEMTGMPNKSSEDRRICLYQSIQKGCLHCTSSRPCPPLIVIAIAVRARDG